MPVSVDEARHVARLARLALTDEELSQLAAELGRVLDHFEKLQELDLSASRRPPSLAPFVGMDGDGRPHGTRADSIAPMLTADEALANAPEREDGAFSVPGFLPEDP